LERRTNGLDGRSGMFRERLSAGSPNEGIVVIGTSQSKGTCGRRDSVLVLTLRPGMCLYIVLVSAYHISNVLVLTLRPVLT
jgi:hypothetical protein